MAVVTMRSRVRYGIAGGGDSGRLSRNEHKILRLFRRARRYPFALLCHELSVPNIFAVLSALRHPGRLPHCVSTAPLDPRRGPRLYFSHYFSESPPSPPPTPFLPLLLFLRFSSRLVRSKRFYTRERSRLSYLASLLGEDLSCGTLAASRGESAGSTRGKSVGTLVGESAA